MPMDSNIKPEHREAQHHKYKARASKSRSYLDRPPKTHEDNIRDALDHLTIIEREKSLIYPALPSPPCCSSCSGTSSEHLTPFPGPDQSPREPALNRYGVLGRKIAEDSSKLLKRQSPTKLQICIRFFYSRITLLFIGLAVLSSLLLYVLLKAAPSSLYHKTESHALLPNMENIAMLLLSISIARCTPFIVAHHLCETIITDPLPLVNSTLYRRYWSLDQISIRANRLKSAQEALYRIGWEFSFDYMKWTLPAGLAVDTQLEELTKAREELLIRDWDSRHLERNIWAVVAYVLDELTNGGEKLLELTRFNIRAVDSFEKFVTKQYSLKYLAHRGLSYPPGDVEKAKTQIRHDTSGTFGFWHCFDQQPMQLQDDSYPWHGSKPLKTLSNYEREQREHQDRLEKERDLAREQFLDTVRPWKEYLRGVRSKLVQVLRILKAMNFNLVEARKLGHFNLTQAELPVAIDRLFRLREIEGSFCRGYVEPRIFCDLQLARRGINPRIREGTVYNFL